MPPPRASQSTSSPPSQAFCCRRSLTTWCAVCGSQKTCTHSLRTACLATPGRRRLQARAPLRRNRGRLQGLLQDRRHRDAARKVRHPGAGWWHGARLLCCASTPPLTPPPQIFTFYKAQGKKTGASLVEEDKVELAKSLMARFPLHAALSAALTAVRALPRPPLPARA